MNGTLLMIVGGGLLAAAIKWRAHWTVKCVLGVGLCVVIAVTADGQHIVSQLTAFVRALGDA